VTDLVIGHRRTNDGPPFADLFDHPRLRQYFDVVGKRTAGDSGAAAKVTDA
jgi:hypothetical protein